MTISPLAPARFPDIPAIAGLRLATAASGMKYSGRDDLMLMQFDPAASVAGVFTLSDTAAAPVQWCQQILQGHAGDADHTPRNPGQCRQCKCLYWAGRNDGGQHQLHRYGRQARPFGG